MINYEMASADSPEELIYATQRSIFVAIQDSLAQLKGELGVPGLTWEQIEFFIECCKEKKPTIIYQKGEM